MRVFVCPNLRATASSLHRIASHHRIVNYTHKKHTHKTHNIIITFKRHEHTRAFDNDADDDGWLFRGLRRRPRPPSGEFIASSAETRLRSGTAFAYLQLCHDHNRFRSHRSACKLNTHNNHMT